MFEHHTAIAAIHAALGEAERCHQRRVVVLAGCRDWSAALLGRLLTERPVSDAVWIGGEPPVALPALPPDQCLSLLGRNLEMAVYDCWFGLHPNGLAAVAGAIGGGGILILCTPPLSQWQNYADPDYQRLLVHPFTIDAIVGRFLAHFIGSIIADRHALVIAEGEQPVLPAATAEFEDGYPLIAGHSDQQRAVDAIIHVLEGHSRRPLLMTADRGRGKSSALGIASAKMMQVGYRQLVITAPRLSAVEPVFYHAAVQLNLPAPDPQMDHLRFGDASLRFLPPDELLRQSVAIDLLMVDEAAAIPAPLLEGLLRRYNRVVFSTTVQGYEGTGRGFEIRFKPTLRQLSNQVQEIQLKQPIRWAEHDPVEQWLYRALLLDARPAEPGDFTTEELRRCAIDVIDRDQLLQQAGTLRELFGLLVLAHYQTTPSDLRNLLDGPNVKIWLCCLQGKVVGAALIAIEGGFDQQLSQAIWRGERRPRGHLLPQTLAAHSGFQLAPELQYWRVMRIAVHPQLQRNGLGQQLMREVINAARSHHIDLVGSSFAASADVVAFWRSTQCVPVRLGFTRDASSGCHSALVLSALSERGNELLQQAQYRFAELFPRVLDNQFCDLDSELVLRLLSELPVFDGYRLQQQDWLDIMVFAKAGRQLSDSRLALWKLTLTAIETGDIFAGLNESQRQMLVKSVLQQKPESALCRELGVNGKKALMRQLRHLVSRLYQALLERRERVNS